MSQSRFYSSNKDYLGLTGCGASFFFFSFYIVLFPFCRICPIPFLPSLTLLFSSFPFVVCSFDGDISKYLLFLYGMPFGTVRYPWVFIHFGSHNGFMVLLCYVL
ncbi:hypothetical protein, unlikely [Trypanosoma brucei gambiense DAL972]|uniref:Uncharacterized protein n=1 Tax=Trypanosoma brucei gambiense (strain MHOM/CI/86/DAL972) TaxID=679716 RepID=C9ZT71_TRYB9|nr:hypothetical protein, unlikely [Trypanosoma brucei gambiense DAL972]CBH12606.1 hypothetical protein, unlikely [Trypanosoma brucei gambiense DAL972]|eukprot:XP_011774886.1 hypothetical protein, unlikely [Trypanosoma brucei gambiense DAL972]